MRKILLSILALTSFAFVSAQSRVFNNPDNKAYFGLRGTLDVPVPCKFTVDGGGVSYEAKYLGNGAGFSFGGIYNIPVVANFYIEPGVSVYYNAMGIKLAGFDDLFDDIEDAADDMGFDGVKFTNRSIRQWGMRSPVSFGYHFDFTRDFSLHVYSGPVLNVGFTSDFYIKAKSGGYEFKATGSLYDEERYGSYNRVNLDWRIGAGITYKNFFGGMSGDIGLTNAYKRETRRKTVTYHQNVFQISVGYNFN